MIFGMNPNADLVLALIGLKRSDVERFRDCGMNEDGVIIHTRTGGGNREDFPQELLVKNANYLSDEDCEGDCTYANYYFKFPDDIKDDCLKFLDVKANGVPASIIQRVTETMNRPETPGDKWAKIYDQQEKVYKNLRQQLQVYETNGHTIVPLSDEAMECLLKVAEENDYPGREGEFVVYSIRPYKLHIQTEVPQWSHQPDRLCRVKIDLGSKWGIDLAVWARYNTLFADKYPKAMAKLSAQIETQHA